MHTIRFERENAIGSIVLANPPFNRIDLQFAESLRHAVHDASESNIRVLVVRAEGPHFSFGGEVRKWPGKDINWFRTFVAEVNLSYRAIEALRVRTIAAVQGVAFGGGFELALNCDFIIAAENAVFRCVEVTTGMLPLAGALQRLAERVVAHARRVTPCSANQSPGRWRPARHCHAGRPRSGARARGRTIRTQTRRRAHKVLRRDKDAPEGVVGGRRAGGRRDDARHHHGSLQHRGFHPRLLECGQGVRCRRRAAGSGFPWTLNPAKT